MIIFCDEWEGGRYERHSQVWSSPALSADGTVAYVGSDDGNLYAVTTADGTKKWSFKTGFRVSARG